ncbi:hypothetical protein [Burkholderia pyrrocinia]|uniref:hypothetical protein n=1 Tax=Burkholderia pyrrocinia TaxID=60550 RepID=UPI00104A4D45|nr:hypothetical protein [Burkholderia pyrrocinia]TDA47469.1 hypothetical protein EVG18_10665 [Burkholderia pyrrocinia]
MHRIFMKGGRQSGQAYIEYFVATGLIAAALLVGGDASVFNVLLTAFKNYFNAYSFAISQP